MNCKEIKECVEELVPHIIRQELTENDAIEILHEAGYTKRMTNNIVEGMMNGITERLTENDEITKQNMLKRLIRALDNDPDNRNNEKLKEYIRNQGSAVPHEKEIAYNIVAGMDKKLEGYI